jgi:hypothetical protein
MIRFLKAGGATFDLSGLTLAVVTGLLQSLVEATPQRIGQTYLRRLYDRLHMLDNTGHQPTGPALNYSKWISTKRNGWIWNGGRQHWGLHSRSKRIAPSKGLLESHSEMEVYPAPGERYRFWGRMANVQQWRLGWEHGGHASTCFHRTGKSCVLWSILWSGSLLAMDGSDRPPCFTSRTTWSLTTLSLAVALGVQNYKNSFGVLNTWSSVWGSGWRWSTFLGLI